jgi:HK97 family phage major capsid protein
VTFITQNGVDPLIPVEEADEIIKALPTQSAAMSMFRTKRMSSKTQRMPVLSALATAGFVNGAIGTDPPGRKPLTALAWQRKELIAEEIAAIVAIPEEFLDDSAFPIWPEVREDLITAIGAVVDGAVFFGVNKPATWTDAAIVPGAIAAGNAFVRGSVPSQRIDVDISDTMALVEADGFEVNGHTARQGLRSSLRGLRDENGQPIYIANPQGGVGQRPTIYDVDATFVRNGAWDNDEAELVTGDYSKAILGIRRDITWKALDQAVIQDPATGAIILNLAQQDMVALRVVVRLAYAVANPVTRLNTDAGSRYPFAVLRPVGAS